MYKIIVSFLFLFATLTIADEARDIVARLDDNMRGQSVSMKLEMRITSAGHTRTMQMQSWSKGQKKSFVKILYPPKDRGITFLSLNHQMWQYIPKIERTIKIPPSMMLQNWMGSDITNDDMVKQSSLLEDYTPKILARKGKIVTLELIPKASASVVWGKIISQIDTQTYTSLQDIFYDDEGAEVRTFKYSQVKKFGRYYLPTKWKIIPHNKRGNSTQIALKEVHYDEDISEIYFGKQALKKFSR